MTSNDLKLNSNTETLTAPVPVGAAGDLDRRRAEPASTANFTESRNLDTRPTQHMTATWGN
jgi:hypothetical protein